MNPADTQAVHAALDVIEKTPPALVFAARWGHTVGVPGIQVGVPNYSIGFRLKEGRAFAEFWGKNHRRRIHPLGGELAERVRRLVHRK